MIKRIGQDARREIEKLTTGYPDKCEYFVDHLARGIAKIAAPWHPHPVIVRLSDFKSNEYADLIGGRQFEQEESNPMLGFRGASRYYHERYRDAPELVLSERVQRRYPAVIAGMLEEMFTVTNPAPKHGAMSIALRQLKKQKVRWRDLLRDGWKAWRTFG